MISTLQKIVLIGASTGGPGQIERIIQSLPILNNTAIIIAQHMSIDFIPSFTKRLQTLSLNSVNMVDNSTLIQSTNIYICHGITSVRKESDGFRFNVESSKQYKYNPDINTVFNSFVPFIEDVEILAVILTGIGDDGINGCAELALRGVRTITQDEKSSIVDGMPSRARSCVNNIEISDIAEIKEKIRNFCS
ncbi:MAG: chemotaxis protein CheB [Sulfurimonas sp.]|uniref:chemotaxis protein CheB n=1 Tax=Sulfurimonas sp. TaxID=2022749 RepID=UPI0025E0BB36|nr:chemotaxis protein CheB [Sulfurimonas sp.]MCK9455463.1 chemotaxis protein CheB [Sulfurimonas sp.]